VRGPAERRHREALSLALSALVHAFVLIGLPAVLWTAPPPREQPVEPPRVVEVELVRAERPAAPVDAPRPLAPSAPEPARADAARPAASAPAVPGPERLAPSRTVAPRPAPPARLALAAPSSRPPAPTSSEALAALEPVVECRVRLVSREIERPRLERPAWLQVRADAAAEAFRAEPLQDRYALAAPGSPTAQPPAPSLAERADPAAAPPAGLPFVAHTHGLEGLSPAEAALVRAALEGPPIPVEGDRQPLIDSIQARLDAVTPLVHDTAWGCREAQGRAELRFLIGPRGYALGYQLVRSTGSYCLDTYINEVLHLAEPFPVVQGWVPVHVAFERFRGSLGD